MSRIGGVGGYGVISICLFFAVFIGVIVWTLCLKRKYVNKMRNMPFDDAATPKPDADSTAHPEDHHD